MSLATLARKTKAKQRVSTRGKFILNMTGRGHVLGMNAKMSRGNCKGFTKCAGKRAACCVGVGGSRCCEFPHGGQPAPQMGYRVYLNRKSKGAYRPAGGKQCKTLLGCERAKIVWQQGSNLDASVVTTNRKDNVLACNSDVYTAKRDTCTGCKPQPVVCDDPDYSLTVGSDANSTFNFAGIDLGLTMNIVPGSISSTTLVGADIAWIGYQIGGNFNNIFTIVLTTPNIPQDSFSSITFVNCNDNSMRTYNTVDASYNANGLWSGLHPGLTIWNWTEPIVQGGGPGWVNGVTGTVDSAEQQWWADMAGVTLVTTPSAGPGGIPTIVGSQTTLKVYIDNPNPDFCCGCKCCPVKKNICGCRATDLVRYTRINKSFGCQTTKAVRMGRSASEQIARNRAAVDCIKPKHRTIHITINATDISFDGCCGDQCLIPGQQYTFVFTLGTSATFAVSIEWCTGLTQILANRTWTAGETFTISLTIPKFSSLPCLPATAATIRAQSATATLDYCKQAFKRPQMLGSCAGR